VPIAEAGAAQYLPNGFYDGFAKRTVIEMFLHPQGNVQKYIRCTYKTAAFLILMAVQRALPGLTKPPIATPGLASFAFFSIVPG
jgi:hypothetical protein